MTDQPETRKFFVHVEQIYQINEDPGDFDQLFRLWELYSADGTEVCFDLHWCRFLRPNAVAFLGGLARLIEYRGGRVQFNWDIVDAAVAANLAQNGFMAAFGAPRRPWSGNSIPYREDSWHDPYSFEHYLTEMWLGRGWVNVSAPLSNAIVGNMAEVYLNAFDHSRSPVGVFTCGQHFPKKQELNLTIVDFGVGVPSNVRSFQANNFSPDELGAANCMEWAFQRGTSTRLGRPGLGPCGLGLDLLREFVQQNGGRLEMFSHEGYVCVADGQVTFGERPTFFEGTLVNISLRCDEKYYCLASELRDEPPF